MAILFSQDAELKDLRNRVKDLDDRLMMWRCVIELVRRVAMNFTSEEDHLPVVSIGDTAR